MTPTAVVRIAPGYDASRRLDACSESLVARTLSRIFAMSAVMRPSSSRNRGS